jgi:cold shock CspA family protein
MLTGRVVRFDEMRGYGFIAPDRGGEDVFVHANVLGEDKYMFSPGLPVEFEVTEGDRGLKAHSVRILTDRAAVPAAAASPGTAPAAAAAAPAPAAAAAGPARPQVPGTEYVSADRPDGDEDLCDVLTASLFSHELTELLLESAPTLTAAQITQLRSGLIGFGKRHGWVEG